MWLLRTEIKSSFFKDLEMTFICRSTLTGWHGRRKSVPWLVRRSSARVTLRCCSRSTTTGVFLTPAGKKWSRSFSTWCENITNTPGINISCTRLLCFAVVIQVVIVSVCVRPSLRTLRSVTVEECTYAGGHRNSAVSCLLTFFIFMWFCVLILCVSSALQCENGLVYEACGPVCSPECPSAPSNPETLCSALSCVEGCFCPHGTVRHGKRCVCVQFCLNCPFTHFSSSVYRWRLYLCVSVSVPVGRIFVSCRSVCCSTLSELVSLEDSFVSVSLYICHMIFPFLSSTTLITWMFSSSCVPSCWQLCSVAHVLTARGIVSDLHVLLRHPVRIQSISVRADLSAVFRLSGSVIMKTTAVMVLMRSVLPRVLRVTFAAPEAPVYRWSSGVTDTPTAPTNQMRTSVCLPHQYLSVLLESSCAQTDAVCLSGKSVTGSWIVDLRMILMSTVCLFTFRMVCHVLGLEVKLLFYSSTYKTKWKNNEQCFLQHLLVLLILVDENTISYWVIF